MGEAMFYHLTRSALPATLGLLVEKSLERGWRVAVRGTDPARMERLDAALWLGPEDRFLPHGLAGGPHDARQPVLLTVSDSAPNAPDCLIAVDGAAVAAGEVAGHARVCIVFDGADADQLAHARGQWRALTGAGVHARYWSEEAGRWEMKAESGG